MTQILDAIYEKGAFHPVQEVDPALSEGQRVRIVVESQGPEDILELAAKVFEGLSDRDVEDVERIALDRSKFFAERR
jgi:predicted DNA-binding antitoxin AbrB/MazE fold protein